MTDRCVVELAGEFPDVATLDIRLRLDLWDRVLAVEMTSPSFIEQESCRRVRRELDRLSDRPADD